jgi:hypothetical protein
MKFLEDPEKGWTINKAEREQLSFNWYPVFREKN